MSQIGNFRQVSKYDVLDNGVPEILKQYNLRSVNLL